MIPQLIAGTFAVVLTFELVSGAAAAGDAARTRGAGRAGVGAGVATGSSNGARDSGFRGAGEAGGAGLDDGAAA